MNARPSSALFLAVASVSALLALQGAAEARGDGLVQPSLHVTQPGTAGPVVALTLDACSGRFDWRIANALVEKHIPATVFVTHRWLKRNGPALAVLMAHPDLFELENHGDRHIPAVTTVPTVYGLVTAGSLPAVRAEVDGGEAALVAATGAPAHWYRDATARYSPDAVAAIEAEGYRIAGFSLNADVGASLPAQSVAHRIEKAAPGDVIIAHINQPGRPAGEGVVEGVEALSASGYRFVRLDQADAK